MRIIINAKIDNGLGTIAACYTGHAPTIAATCHMGQTHGARIGGGVDTDNLADNMAARLVVVTDTMVMGFGAL
jgi:hypothetical protein